MSSSVISDCLWSACDNRRSVECWNWSWCVYFYLWRKRWHRIKTAAQVTETQEICERTSEYKSFFRCFFFSGFLPLQWAVMLQFWEIITAFLHYFKIPQLNQNYFLMVNQCFWKMSRIFIYKIGKLCTSVFNT